MKIRKSIAASLFCGIIFFSTFSYAQMSGGGYVLHPSVLDSAGQQKDPGAFQLLDAVGQPTPIGRSQGGGYILEAGFLYELEFSITLDNAFINVTEGLGVIANDPNLPAQQGKKIDSAIQFLQQAMDAFALYQAGDPNALANALNKTKSAINKLVASGVNTDGYQQMLAQAAELAVTTEVDRIALLAGETSPNVVQARVFLINGSNELLNSIYGGSVQSFMQAYNEALLAI